MFIFFIEWIIDFIFMIRKTTETTEIWYLE